MSASSQLPSLCVEGSDDLSVISALLKRHGLDTQQGGQHLRIHQMGDIDTLLTNMPDTIRNAVGFPVGFVLDIDIELTRRWDAVRGRLLQLGVTPPSTCPPNGYFGQLQNYPHRFGVWLMPDCKTDGQMLEHLIQSLMPANHPLWPHALSSTAIAANLVHTANAAITGNAKKWERFSDTARIKAEVRSWLAWQRQPGVQLGAAINDHILGDDSPEAIAFLRWLKQLYGFVQLQV